MKKLLNSELAELYGRFFDSHSNLAPVEMRRALILAFAELQFLHGMLYPETRAEAEATYSPPDWAEEHASEPGLWGWVGLVGIWAALGIGLGLLAIWGALEYLRPAP